MSNWTDVTFKIRRHTDREVLAALTHVIAEAGIQLRSLEFRWPGYRHPQSVQPTELEANVPIQDVLAADERLFSSITCHIWGAVYLLVTRPEADAFDVLTVGLSQADKSPPVPEVSSVSGLIRALKAQLSEITHADYLSLLGPTVQRHFEEREASLARLEDTLAAVARQFTSDAGRIRAEEDEHLRARRVPLAEEIAKERADLNRTHQKKQDDLAAQETALAERLTQVDDQAARQSGGPASLGATWVGVRTLGRTTWRKGDPED